LQRIIEMTVRHRIDETPGAFDAIDLRLQNFDWREFFFFEAFDELIGGQILRTVVYHAHDVSSS
jgi:hypothetical protein